MRVVIFSESERECTHLYLDGEEVLSAMSGSKKQTICVT